MKHKKTITDIFKRPALEAAPLLIGCILERRIDNSLIRLRIVETEAYHQDDPASHTYNGQTVRTKPMFMKGGHLYVYFTYGMHHCLNIVTGPKGVGEAVLIRAAEPLQSIELIRKYRNKGKDDLITLTNGPGKLAQALGINSTDLSGKTISPATIDIKLPSQPVNMSDIKVSSRIGISKAKDSQWRFYLANNNFVSKF